MKLTINISARDFDKANYVIGQSLKMWRDDPTDFELRMGTPLLESELKAAETLKNTVKKAFIREIKVGWKKPKTKLEGESQIVAEGKSNQIA